MSGVFPGTRTAVYQRLYLTPLQPGRAPLWADLLWSADPPAVAVVPRPSGPPAPPLARIEDPSAEPDLLARLRAALAAAGWQLNTCGVCRHWRGRGATNDDGVPLGSCGWRPPPSGGSPVPAMLATQSALALSCPHFAEASITDTIQQPDAPQAAAAGDAQRVPKAAELDPDRLSFWPRLRHRLRRRLSGPADPAPSAGWETHIVERSGVGAGTEPCFGCQGRIANLGALAVASPEGDKQTLSIWRCRRCGATYFNDWTDRWERLDSLETEERYHRIAPAEALYALTVIQREVGADHPAGRDRRHALRDQLLALTAGRPPLSHQIRQGR
jgi:hypothetical protein